MNRNILLPKIIKSWLTGWSLSRELPLPVEFKSGYKVDVGYENQKARYVFPYLNNDFIELANSIDEAWVYLKVCASPEEIKRYVLQKWIVQPQGFMMNCYGSMKKSNIHLNQDYLFQYAQYNSTYIVKVIAKDGTVASIGRVILVDDLAIYDRIFTDTMHQRKGLATCIIKELEKIAISKGITNNFLVATEQGKLLYESLGWELYSLYTSIVIPG